MKHAFLGFTLMELLIILVIVGLLVQVAVPQYQFFIQKSAARERLSDLLSLQTDIESCYLKTLDYAPCVEALSAPASGYLEKEAGRHTYRLAIVAPHDDVFCPRVETDHEHVMIGACL